MNKFKSLNFQTATFIQKLEMDTDINWWNTNRKKINHLIDMYNKTVMELDYDIKKDLLNDLIFECDFMFKKEKKNEENHSTNSLSDWQFDMIKDIKELAQDTLNNLKNY